MSDQSTEKPEQTNQPDSARADLVNVPQNSTPEKADAGKIFLEETAAKNRAARLDLWHTIRVPLLAVLTAHWRAGGSRKGVDQLVRGAVCRGVWRPGPHRQRA
jgi:hypothetical protein